MQASKIRRCNSAEPFTSRWTSAFACGVTPLRPGGTFPVSAEESCMSARRNLSRILLKRTGSCSVAQHRYWIKVRTWARPFQRYGFYSSLAGALTDGLTSLFLNSLSYFTTHCSIKVGSRAQAVIFPSSCVTDGMRFLRRNAVFSFLQT